ncbi:hypothetical protein [uncultured Sphingobacterium sp.]|uniref:hypothetical protein n=2 Tax=Sphingobacterium TaxID=28453 RepID=UPI0025EFBC6B|nr:hypothetical protein [uncultured Sphingobacterium sp.]
MRSGAKIGSLGTNFQAFCSYLFHFGHNSLEGWEIIFQQAPPGGKLQGQTAYNGAPGGETGRQAAAPGQNVPGGRSL